MISSYFCSMNDIIIRPVRQEEYELLAGIGRQTFYETWRPVNTEEDMQAYIKGAFDTEKIRKDLADSAVNTFYFSFENDSLSGYAKLRNDRTYPELEGKKALELERVYVQKRFQGMLSGKSLMDQCIAFAKANNYYWLWLGVNIDNARAIAFYKKYGFTVFGTKMFKLGDAEDEDYLMKLKL